MPGKIKRITAVILFAATVFSLASCGGDKSPAVMTLGEYSVSANVYHYWASSAKGQYLYSYEDVQNTEECWQKELSEGVTVAQYFDSVTLETVKANLAAIKLFDDFGLEITKDEEKSVSDYISDLVKEYADGSEKMMNTALSEYGINMDILREIYLDETKSTAVFNYLYGESGKEKLKNKDYEDYFQKNYVRFQLIYINNAYTYVTDGDGSRVTDDDGVYKTEPLTGEEKEKKDAKVREVEQGLASGEGFYDLYDKYSEIKDYENGYYYAVNETYSDEVFYKLTDSAKNAEVGETVKVETENGTCFIIKEELTAGAWKDNANADFFSDFQNTVKETAYREKLKTQYADITVDEEAVKAFSVSKITPCYTF